MSEKADLYEFKMALFDNGDPEDFLLFVRNLNMNLEASGTLATYAKFQYLHTLVRGKSLRQFEFLFSEGEGTDLLKLETIILGLAS